MTLYLSRGALLPAFVSMTLLAGCNNLSPATAPIAHPPAPTTPISPAVEAVVGDYVSEGYAKRAQGYDWVAVLITANQSAHEAEQIKIKVRSRSDIKKPTCQYEASASLLGQDRAHGIIFETRANDSKVFLQFKENKLTIDSEDKYALNTFCSGGGSIVGEYQKLAGKIELN